MRKMREEICACSREEQNGLSLRMESDFGDLEEKIKEIVESDVEDVEDVDAARREYLTHLANLAIDSAEPLK